ncbi:hypothetical protein HYV86_02010 [Candidatus Woesearchaeota archaeon]|nr:hypothetical protein [Candidatus Woesearchaeota archaeon]
MMKKETKSFQKRGIGLLMMFLILTLPFYSASAMAVSVQVTKNTGDDQIPNFIDAEADTWSVEATIRDITAEQVTAETVHMNIEGNREPFQSCGQSPAGIVCTYSNQLQNGIGEGSYPFNVELDYTNEEGIADTAESEIVSIKADGTGPEVKNLRVVQNQNRLDISFAVDERPQGNAVGIHQIQIINADTSEILDEKTLDEPGDSTFRYPADVVEGQALFTLTGEGRTRLRVRAVDYLGHETISNAVAVQYDFAAPTIQSFNLTKLGSFVGTQPVSDSKLTIDIVEKNGPVNAKVRSEQITNIPVGERECVEVPEQEDLWRCTWEGVTVEPVSTISITVDATDARGNPATQTLSQSFTLDNTPPVVDYFNTVNTFEGTGFIQTADDTVLLLRAHDEGAGITKEGIRASFQGLANGGGSVAPQECLTLDDGSIECRWNIRAQAGADDVTVGLSTFQDNVGNEGSVVPVQLIVDADAPVIERVAFFGVSEVGTKDYIQSRDELKIELDILESESSPVIIVDMNNAVNDAATLYPATAYAAEGFAVFNANQEACVRDELKWKCEIVSQPIRSGYVRSVEVSVQVLDTAANKAVKWPETVKNARMGGSGIFSFELLGLEEDETDPDFWAVQSVTPQIAFVDIDAVALTAVRIPFKITFSTKQEAEVVGLEFQECLPKEGEEILPTGTHVRPSGAQALAGRAGETDDSEPLDAESVVTSSNYPEISRSLLVGSTSSSPTLLLEFNPFDAKEVLKVEEQDEFKTLDVAYTCTFKIFSKVGKNAIVAPETQHVTVRVPFGFSSLGSIDENIDDRVDEIKDEVIYKLTDKLRIFADILKYVRFFTGIINILRNVMIMFEFVTSSSDAIAYAFPVFTKPIGIGTCEAAQAAGFPLKETLAYTTPIIQILDCAPQPTPGSIYKNWQSGVLNVYNAWKGQAFIASGVVGDGDFSGRNNIVEAKSLYDNIWVSSLGLCIPGIIENLEKYRQTRCMEIQCIEESVPAGVATIESCKQIGDLLACKYVWGELVSTFIPGTAFFEAIKNIVTSFLRSPISLVRTAATLTCSYLCPTSGTAVTVCNYTGFIVTLFDTIDSIIGLVDRWEGISYDVCSKYEDDYF